MSLVIHGAQVLDEETGALEPSSVVVERDLITQVGEHVDPPRDAEYVDASGQFMIPGLVNAHTHAHANIVKGVADKWSLEDLLNFSAAVYGNRTPEEHYLSAALGAVEMVKSGCTSAYDLFMALPAPDEEALEAVVRAYTDIGMRAVVAPAVADIVFHQTVPGLLGLLPTSLRAQVEQSSASPTDALLDVTERFVERWHDTAGGRVRAAVAPTIPGQCTDELLLGLRALARRHELGYHVHLAETKTQVVHALHRWGTTSVEALDTMGILDERFVGAHGVWLTFDDVRRLAAREAMIAHNPASNLKLGSGIAPVRELLDQGVEVALGTDGSISSDNQNMFQAVRLVPLVSTVRFPYQQARWIGAPEAFAMATSAGARAIGSAETIGKIKPGWKADIAILDGRGIALNPVHDLRRSITYAETGESVDTVIVDGNIVVRSGKIVTVDEGELVRQASAVAEQLRARQPTAWSLAHELRPYLQAACSAAAKEPIRFAGDLNLN